MTVGNSARNRHSDIRVPCSGSETPQIPARTPLHHQEEKVSSINKVETCPRGNVVFGGSSRQTSSQRGAR